MSFSEPAHSECLGIAATTHYYFFLASGPENGKEFWEGAWPRVCKTPALSLLGKVASPAL